MLSGFSGLAPVSREVTTLLSRKPRGKSCGLRLPGKATVMMLSPAWSLWGVMSSASRASPASWGTRWKLVRLDPTRYATWSKVKSTQVVGVPWAVNGPFRKLPTDCRSGASVGPPPVPRASCTVGRGADRPSTIL